MVYLLILGEIHVCMGEVYMEGKIIISEPEMDNLASEFESSDSLMIEIRASLESMRETLINSVYEGGAKADLENSIRMLEKRAQLLADSFEAMYLFVRQVKDDFKNVDTSLASEAKNLVKTEIPKASSPKQEVM